MIRSMTGYVSRSYNHLTFALHISLRSLNHKFLEVNLRGNASWLGLESELRSMTEKTLSRGKIDVTAEFELFDPGKFNINLNAVLLDKIVHMVEPTMKKDDRFVLNVDSLLKLPGVFNLNYADTPFNDEEKAFIRESYQDALNELLREKAREGDKLREPLNRYGAQIRENLEKIRLLSAKQPEVIKEKFAARLKELYSLPNFSESRFYEEVVFFIDKSNIAEEMDRLESHLKYLEEMLSPEYPEPPGWKVGFLMQECLREVNTIGSKTQDAEISRVVIHSKELIENIKEQILNIE